MRYSKKILHYTSFGEKSGFWRTFCNFGEYANYIKSLLNAKANAVKLSVTASLTTD